MTCHSTSLPSTGSLRQAQGMQDRQDRLSPRRLIFVHNAKQSAFLKDWRSKFMNVDERNRAPRDYE